MPIPLHTAHIYQKPKLGNTFIQRLLVYNYEHSIDAIGGFDSAAFDVALRSVDEAQQFLDQYLGNRVAIFVDNPVEAVWEGFINRMTFSAGGTEYSISLDKMANRVKIIYNNAEGSTTTTQSAAASDTASSDLYGIKQEQVDAGLMVVGSGVTTLRDTILAQRAWPKTSMTQTGSSKGLVHVECLGFYHTLSWEDYRNAASANVQLGNLVDTILGGLVNGATFFDNTDLTETIANTSTVNQFSTKGETVWDTLLKLAEIGDAASYYVIGIRPTNFQTGTRRAYYQLASTSIVYTARRSDGLRIRNLYGQLVPPWTVRPDAGIRVSDDLIGWNGVGDNPTETYIRKIDYNANQQTAIFSGDDDLTAEGIFNWNRFNKPHANRKKDFGAARRLA